MSESNPPGSSPASCRWSGAAALFVLGALGEDESASFEAHLGAGCPVCSLEHDEIAREVAEVDLAALTDAAPSLPSPQLRERLLAQVEDREPAEPVPGRSWQHWQSGALPGGVDAAGLRTVPAGEGGFEPTAFAGSAV